MDILVQLDKPLGLGFIRLTHHPEELLGRRVDLVTLETLQTSMENYRYKRIASDIEKTLGYV